ncbi:MAG: hypothetical protein ACYC5M_03205 [Anaerolineae bacterium]
MARKKVTEKQLAANRANALKATGPRTIEGKARSRWNALTHGALAHAVIPPDLEPFESRQAFNALLTALHEEFAPASAIEALLVERIATSYWRLARILQAESADIIRHQNRPLPVATPPSITRIFDRPGFDTAQALADHHPPAEPEPRPYLGVPYIDRSLQYARYEAAIERQLYRALDALERLQRLRLGDTVPPPLHLHIDTTVEDRQPPDA